MTDLKVKKEIAKSHAPHDLSASSMNLLKEFEQEGYTAAEVVFSHHYHGANDVMLVVATGLKAPPQPQPEEPAAE